MYNSLITSCSVFTFTFFAFGRCYWKSIQCIQCIPHQHVFLYIYLLPYLSKVWHAPWVTIRHAVSAVTMIFVLDALCMLNFCNHWSPILGWNKVSPQDRNYSLCLNTQWMLSSPVTTVVSCTCPEGTWLPCYRLKQTSRIQALCVASLRRTSTQNENLSALHYHLGQRFCVCGRFCLFSVWPEAWISEDEKA